MFWIGHIHPVSAVRRKGAEPAHKAKIAEGFDVYSIDRPYTTLAGGYMASGF